MGTSLPLSEWPEADTRMWNDLTRRGGPFDDRGAFAHLRQTSLRIYQSAYAHWLHWLGSEEPIALTEAPVSRATLARLRSWHHDSRELSPTSRKMHFNGTLRVLRAADPQRDWSPHLRVAHRLEQLAGRGSHARKQGRILSNRVLLEAGLRLAGSEADAATTALGRAKAQRDGAMVAFLAMMPALRHRALAGLTFGQFLVVTDRALTVVLSEDLTKTGVPWEADVPEPAATALRRCLLEARPFLLSRGRRVHDALWVGDGGNPMGYSYIGYKIPDTTERLTGIRVPPHFFRDAAATTLARESPGAALVIAPVLGHAGARTAERHYIQAGSVEVGRDYARVIAGLKRKA